MNYCELNWQVVWQKTLKPLEISQKTANRENGKYKTQNQEADDMEEQDVNQNKM